TAHAFYKELQETSGCPVINMLEASLQYIDQSHPGAQVCILGTLGTVQTRTYEKYNHFSLTIIYPEETLCEEVHALIYDIKKNILPSVDDFVRRLSHIMNQVAGNDSNIVFLLACTELSVLGAENFPEYTVLDALDILSLVSVAASTKKLKIRAPYDEKIISEIAQNYK
ncbi:MAG: aspartate/glutamate racemase family protein, partial [Lachnospiraceae bacterium]|nr:aspartate/glutamate racemase family protein [Lachnospiraceae bacterium]